MTNIFFSLDRSCEPVVFVLLVLVTYVAYRLVTEERDI